MARKKRLLIVDDDPLNLRTFKTILKEQFITDCAANGEEALKKAARFKPDILLLDILMPGINGYEICTRIKSGVKKKQIKVVLVSGLTSVRMRLKGYKAGADAFIRKPVGLKELQEKLIAAFA